MIWKYLIIIIVFNHVVDSYTTVNETILADINMARITRITGWLVSQEENQLTIENSQCLNKEYFNKIRLIEFYELLPLNNINCPKKCEISSLRQHYLVHFPRYIGSEVECQINFRKFLLLTRTVYYFIEIVNVINWRWNVAFQYLTKFENMLHEYLEVIQLITSRILQTYNNDLTTILILNETMKMEQNSNSSAALQLHLYGIEFKLLDVEKFIHSEGNPIICLICKFIRTYIDII